MKDAGQLSDSQLQKIFKRLGRYSEKQLESWIRDDAGSQNPIFFQCAAYNGFELQQIPEEYAQLLSFIKNRGIENYLEIGAGAGGTFFINNVFIKNTAKISYVVDNLTYSCFGNQLDKIKHKFIALQRANSSCEYKFFNSSSSEFFETNQIHFDLIFIDGDHDYNAVKTDYINSLKILRRGGIIVLHDIVSQGCPGVVRLWSEISEENKICRFVSSVDCGIGIVSQ